MSAAPRVAPQRARRPVDDGRRRVRRTTGRGIGLAVSAGALLVVVLASLAIGSVAVPWRTVVAALFDADGSNEHLIVRELRLPRTLIGVAVGAALAVAGAAMQAITRNALASPTILGINAGASFAIVTAVYVLGVVSPGSYVAFALAGATSVSVLVYAIAAAGRGGATPVRLALAGAVVTALLGSWISAILVFHQRTLDEVRFWLAGSLAGRELDLLVQVLPLLGIGLVGLLAMARHLNTIALGEHVATGLGQNTTRVRLVTGVLVVLLAGSAVAVAGPVAFVGLAVPHAVRAVVGPDHRWLLPCAAVHGAVLLLVADIVGRVVMRPAEIQVGIVTALVGAPVFIHLVRSRRLGLL
jgi:iron complex transport system permease protein